MIDMTTSVYIFQNLNLPTVSTHTYKTYEIDLEISYLIEHNRNWIFWILKKFVAPATNQAK